PAVGGGDCHRLHDGHGLGRNREGGRGGIGGYGHGGRHSRRIEIVACQGHHRATGPRCCAERHRARAADATLHGGWCDGHADQWRIHRQRGGLGHTAVGGGDRHRLHGGHRLG